MIRHASTANEGPDEAVEMDRAAIYHRESAGIGHALISGRFKSLTEHYSSGHSSDICT